MKNGGMENYLPHSEAQEWTPRRTKLCKVWRELGQKVRIMVKGHTMGRDGV